MFVRRGNFGLTKTRINFFNIMAAVCSLLLVVYAWTMFLPMFEGLTQYSEVRNIIIVLSVLLLAVSFFQFYVAFRKEESKPEQIQNSEKT